MPLDPAAVGWESPPRETSWRPGDCLLYALGVGAGPADLAYVTENSIGVEHRALPTMAVVLGQFDDEVWQAMGTFPWAMMVHGGQEVMLHRPIPTEGTIVTTHRLAAMWDKGKAAVVEVESNAVDAGSGAAMFTLRTSLFIRGEGLGRRPGALGRQPHPRSRPRARGSRSHPAQPGAHLPVVRGPQPAALRPGLRSEGRLRAADPARPLHLWRHRTGAPRGAL